MNINIYQKCTLYYFIAITIFWSVINALPARIEFYDNMYSLLWGFLPLFGGAVAVWGAQQWGGVQSAVGRAVVAIGWSMVLQGLGQSVWLYYNLALNVSVPYPSLADFLFVPAEFLYAAGGLFLAQATGAKYGMRSVLAKMIVVVSVVCISAFAYYILVTVARGGVLITEGGTIVKVFLDLAYPLGDLLALAFAAVISGLSFQYLGGKYRLFIYIILLGLANMFAADAFFSYVTTVGTYHNADLTDFLYSSGAFLLTFGILGFLDPHESALDVGKMFGR
jgi:hypothetical protein